MKHIDNALREQPANLRALGRVARPAGRAIASSARGTHRLAATSIETHYKKRPLTVAAVVAFLALFAVSAASRAVYALWDEALIALLVLTLVVLTGSFVVSLVRSILRG